MSEEIEKVELRQLNIDDYQELRTTEEEAYRNWEGPAWDEQNIRTLLDIFPEGQLAVLVNDKVVGCALSLIVNYERFGDEHSYNEITGNMTFSTHNPRGDILYGIDIFIRPEYRAYDWDADSTTHAKSCANILTLRELYLAVAFPTTTRYRKR